MNYNSLMNKPTINYKELIGDNTVTEVGGITEEQFNTLLSTDLSSYYTKAQIDNLFSRSFVYREKSGSIVTFDCPSTSQSIPELTVGIEATQSGSGDPSPTNVRPISGWSAVNVTKSGKNFYSATLADYSSEQIAEVGLATFYPVKVPYGTYTISTNAPTGYIWAGTNIYDSSTLPRVYEGNPNTVTTDIIWVGLLTTDKSSAYAYNIMINQGSTPSSYEPYNGQTYKVEFKDGDNPLTVYGGTLDVVSGVLTVTHAIRHLKDIASWNRISSGTKAFYQSRGTALPGIVYPFTSADMYPISSAYSYSSSGTQAEGTFRVSDALYIVDNRFENNADFANFLTTNDVTIKYLLATPQTIQLTPTMVKSLLGTNNLWADSGDIEVKCLDRIIPAGE